MATSNGVTQMQPGARVLLRGLESRPELNGARATIAGTDSSGRGRL
jgi:hypothetical protein